jgi:hypothetical protein
MQEGRKKGQEEGLVARIISSQGGERGSGGMARKRKVKGRC